MAGGLAEGLLGAWRAFVGDRDQKSSGGVASVRETQGGVGAQCLVDRLSAGPRAHNPGLPTPCADAKPQAGHQVVPMLLLTRPRRLNRGNAHIGEPGHDWLLPTGAK